MAGDPSDDEQLSIDVAREAGELLLEVRDSFGAVEPGDKARLTLLRDTADAASHDLLAARFAAARPDDAVLSEEGVDDEARLVAPRVWIVDPLDGTFEYGQGRPDFAVHVVLWTDDGSPGGSLSAGTVDLPAQGIVWSTSSDVVPARPLPLDRPVRIVASRSRPPADLDRVVAELAERLGVAAPHGVEVVEVGSVGAKTAELLAGRAEAYLHDTGFYEWDLAAPLAVALAQGYWCTTPDRSGFDFNRLPPWEPGIVMAVPGLASALEAVLFG